MESCLGFFLRFVSFSVSTRLYVVHIDSCYVLTSPTTRNCDVMLSVCVWLCLCVSLLKMIELLCLNRVFFLLAASCGAISSIFHLWESRMHRTSKIVAFSNFFVRLSIEHLYCARNSLQIEMTTNFLFIFTHTPCVEKKSITIQVNNEIAFWKSTFFFFVCWLFYILLLAVKMLLNFTHTDLNFCFVLYTTPWTWSGTIYANSTTSKT